MFLITIQGIKNLFLKRINSGIQKLFDSGGVAQTEKDDEYLHQDRKINPRKVSQFIFGLHYLTKISKL